MRTFILTWFFGSGATLGKTRLTDGSGYDAYKVDYSAGTGNQSRWNTLVGGGPVDYPDRAAIAGADKDHFEPPAGDPPTVRVYRGGVHASRIDLPVIPRR